MKVYEYHDGLAIFVNNEKRTITENAAIVCEHFAEFLGNVEKDLNIERKPMWAPSDEEVYKCITHPDIVAKKGTLNGLQIAILLFKNEIQCVKVNGKKVQVNEAEARSFFNLK